VNVRELIEILKDFPEDQEVELAIVAPVGTDDDIAIDRYPVDGVLPWDDDEEDETVLWLVGGEEGDVEAFLSAIEDEEDEE